MTWENSITSTYEMQHHETLNKAMYHKIQSTNFFRESFLVYSEFKCYCRLAKLQNDERVA